MAGISPSRSFFGPRPRRAKYGPFSVPRWERGAIRVRQKRLVSFAGVGPRGPLSSLRSSDHAGCGSRGFPRNAPFLGILRRSRARAVRKRTRSRSAVGGRGTSSPPSWAAQNFALRAPSEALDPSVRPARDHVTRRPVSLSNGSPRRLPVANLVLPFQSLRRRPACGAPRRSPPGRREGRRANGRVGLSLPCKPGLGRCPAGPEVFLPPDGRSRVAAGCSLAVPSDVLSAPSDDAVRRNNPRARRHNRRCRPPNGTGRANQSIFYDIQRSEI